MEAISGRVIKYQTMADGTPRALIEFDCDLAAASGTLPIGSEVALARLTHQPLPEPETKPEKLKGGPLAELAGQWCKSELFWRFLGSLGWDCKSDGDARAIVLQICKIESRAELDHSEQASMTFHLGVRRPFMEWQKVKV